MKDRILFAAMWLLAEILLMGGALLLGSWIGEIFGAFVATGIIIGGSALILMKMRELFPQYKNEIDEQNDPKNITFG